MRQTRVFTVGAAIVLFLMACAPSRDVLTLSDLDPKLEFLELVGMDVVLVDYPVVGIERYNEFFKSSALIYFAMDFSISMVNDATANLKNYARDHVAGAVMDENIQELIGDTPPDQLSTEQSLAVMRMERERGRISDHEREYFAATAGHLGLATLALARGIKEAPTLIKRGKRLLLNVVSDFNLFGFPKFWEIRPVYDGLNESIDRLTYVAERAPILVEDIAVLISGFKELSEGGEVEEL